TSLTNSNLELKNMFGQFIKMNTTSSSGLGTLPGNTITNPKKELKGITTHSRTAYQRPTSPTTSFSLLPVVEHETEATKDTVHPTNKGSTKDVQPQLLQTVKLVVVLIPSMIVQPPLAKLKTYMLWEPTKVGASHGQNTPPAYQSPAYQAPGYQAPIHQPQIPELQVVTTNEFTNFMKANDAILKNMQTNVTSLTNSNLELKNMFGQFIKMNTTSSSGLGTLPVEHETEATKDTVHPTNKGSTKDVQPQVLQTESPILNSEPIVAHIIEPVAAPVSAPKPNQKLSIPYPSRLHDQKLRGKANDQREKKIKSSKI
nr:reverse transcriptase domain-containing protein [Tanacetum cinerariifolium]